MSERFADRLQPLAERLSPRARQWATLGLIGAVGIGVLTLVFSLGDDSAPKFGTSLPRPDLKPTQVGVMAPGSQVRDSEVWIGQAGKDVAQLKHERDAQQRVNTERAEFEKRLLARLGELEARLKASAEPALSPPPPMPLPVPMPPSRPAAPPYPSETSLPRSTTPPPPTIARGTAPAGVPSMPWQPLPPPLMRVTVTPPTQARAVADATPKPVPKTLDTYLPVSFTRGVLLGGLDAPTGGQSQGNPHPVLIRLSDNSILPNRFRAEYRECFVVAAGYGDISSERAYLRTESLSCVRTDGTALELSIHGSIYGEDGKVGMRGRVVTKQGQMLANALMAGVISGIGQGVSTANTSYSQSSFGQVATVNGSDAMRAGVGSGVGRALDRLAQYYIKLAEQTFPVIEIDAGREIDVVITRGVRISDSAESSKASASVLADRSDAHDGDADDSMDGNASTHHGSHRDED